MMVFNSAYLARFAAGRILDVKKDEIVPGEKLTGVWVFLAVSWIVLSVVALLAFNLGNWVFSFHYFKCASEMKFLGQN